MELYLQKDEIDSLSEKISSIKKLFNLVNKLKKQGIVFDSNGLIHIHLEDKKLITNKEKPVKYPVINTVKSDSYDWHKNPNALVSLYLLSVPEEWKSCVIDIIANNTGCSRRSLIYLMHKETPVLILVTSTLKDALYLACFIERYQGCRCGIEFRPDEYQSKNVLEGIKETTQIDEPILESYKRFKCIVRDNTNY